MRFEKNIFRQGGVSVNYYEKGQGEPLLFLQGGGVRTLTYSTLLNSLSKKYHVISPDLPCFGSGTVPYEIWGLEEYAEFISGFIKSTGINNYTLIGHSLGGRIALELASKGVSIKNLILINSVGIASPYSEIEFRYRFFIQKTIYNLFYYGHRKIMWLIIRDFLVNRFKKFFKWPQIIKILKKCIFNNFFEFKNIKVPTLILWGKEDEIFPVGLVNMMNKSIVNSSLVIVDGNHDWIFFKTDEFLRLFEEWLNKLNN